MEIQDFKNICQKYGLRFEMLIGNDDTPTVVYRNVSINPHSRWGVVYSKDNNIFYINGVCLENFDIKKLDIYLSDLIKKTKIEDNLYKIKNIGTDFE